MNKNQDKIMYQSGFGNYFETEALPGALPVGRNSPQKAPFGLYAEQLSGAAFTALPHENLRSWLYRIMPSVKHSGFRPKHGFDHWQTKIDSFDHATPNQLRWDAFIPSQAPHDLLEGIFSYCIAGDVMTQNGSSVHLYSATKSMRETAFFNTDADMLFVPQAGSLLLRTEFGLLTIEPGEMACIPRGIRFAVELGKEGENHVGYLCENFGAHFQLPYRGPIGANGLANTRDFLYPVAAGENSAKPYTLIQKFCGRFFEAQIEHSPFDVIAWHGNYAPYKYDLRRFNTIGTVSFDHPDPSIFTVLTSPSYRPGVANIDFVIFPPRWMVGEDTFRPPWYHRNIMSEFMGLIYGVYDAKPSGGFAPGGASLHNMMNAHGPDADAFTQATNAALKPHKIENTMAFMFESPLIYMPTDQALRRKECQEDYLGCWSGLTRHFKA